MGKSNSKPADRGTSKLVRIQSIPNLPPRPKDSHKGTFGRVLVIGGSPEMIGAPALVANAALRSGAGLVTVGVPKSIHLHVAALCPCATNIPLRDELNGRLAPIGARTQLSALWESDDHNLPSVVAMGPGIGRGDHGYSRDVAILAHHFNRTNIPIVLDADALNALRRAPKKPEYLNKLEPAGWDKCLHYRTVITPHPGELARMWGVTTKEVQADRQGFAVRTARQMSAMSKHADYRAVVVLKGTGTIVTDGEHVYVNNTGNPGMAIGGSGDVLTGILAALIAQGMPQFDAAVLGVHVHGLAGDLAAASLGQVSLIATDLIEHLPAAFQTLAPAKRRRPR